LPVDFNTPAGSMVEVLLNRKRSPHADLVDLDSHARRASDPFSGSLPFYKGVAGLLAVQLGRGLL
jgi:hypothetical protein